MPKWVACSVCAEPTFTPITVRAQRPDTLAYVEAPTCGSRACAVVFKAALDELEPRDAPRVELEIEFSEDPA